MTKLYPVRDEGNRLDCLHVLKSEPKIRQVNANVILLS